VPVPVDIVFVVVILIGQFKLSKELNAVKDAERQIWPICRGAVIESFVVGQ